MLHALAPSAASTAAVCCSTRLPTRTVEISSIRSPPSIAGGRASRIVEIGAANMRAGLGEVGKVFGRAAEEHQVLGRHLLQQHLRSRVAELAGRAGDDDLAQAEFLSLLGASIITSVTIEAT